VITNRELAEFEAQVAAPPEVLAEARQIIADTIGRKLPLSSSVLTSVIMSVVRRVFTTNIPTMAVSLAADGLPVLLINPSFAVQLGADNAAFVLVHEAYHLILMHLHADPQLSQTPNWQVATEACINWRAQHLLGRGMPSITVSQTDSSGRRTTVTEETGVNPNTVYQDYCSALAATGEKPVARIEDLFRTDLGCYAELERMARLPRLKSTACLHHGEGQDSNAGVTLDPEETTKLAGKALDITLHEAVANGNTLARSELVSLMDGTADSTAASKIWGDLGAGKLRGQTTTTRKTDAWEKWTADAVQTRLRDGERLRYNRKIPWDPRVSPRGRELTRAGVCAIDASGSMHQSVLDKIAALVGDTDNLEITWVNFDGAVWPFVPGEPFRGGGGTNCQLVDAWIERQVHGDSRHGEDQVLDGEPDFVLVITDGYFAKFTPRHPDSWIWLIVPGGDTWPERWNPPMSCRAIDLP